MYVCMNYKKMQIQVDFLLLRVYYYIEQVDKGVGVMKYIKDRIGEYDANLFVNELVYASKLLGLLEAKISSYQFNSIIIPMFHKKEAISSMYIEGTQTTISDVFENEVKSSALDNKIMLEVRNHTNTLIYGADILRMEGFSNGLFKKIHALMMNGILAKQKEQSLGKYKEKDNYIVNSVGKVVFTPPAHTETQKYMDELIEYMNNTTDGVNPLIKAAIAHAQFESIHPFSGSRFRPARRPGKNLPGSSRHSQSARQPARAPCRVCPECVSPR